MTTTLAAFSDQFQYLPADYDDGDIPFDCRPTSAEADAPPIDAVVKDQDDDDEEEDPSFDCAEKCLSPSSTSKSMMNGTVPQEDAPILIESEPTNFVVEAEELPFDEASFEVVEMPPTMSTDDSEHSSTLFTIANAANVVSPCSVKSKKSVTFQIPVKAYRRTHDFCDDPEKEQHGTPDTSYVTTTSSEDDVDEDLSFLSNDSTLEYPSEVEEEDRVFEFEEKAEPGVDEWCLNMVFESLGNENTIEMADWVTKGYKSSKRKVKGIVLDCFVPTAADDKVKLHRVTGEMEEEQKLSVEEESESSFHASDEIDEGKFVKPTVFKDSVTDSKSDPRASLPSSPVDAVPPSQALQLPKDDDSVIVLPIDIDERLVHDEDNEEDLEAFMAASEVNEEHQIAKQPSSLILSKQQQESLNNNVFGSRSNFLDLEAEEMPQETNSNLFDLLQSSRTEYNKENAFY